MANTQSNSPPGGAGDTSPTANNPGTSANTKMRKRTKTGCLTCRKRRIKCGEERPTCANCIKSKRQCEGYNQRVVFKTPIENWPNHPGHVSTIQYHTSMLPGTRNQPYQAPQPNVPGTHPSIQPRALSTFEFASVEAVSNAGMQTPQQVFVSGAPSYDSTYQQPLISPHHQQPLQSPHHHSHISNTATSYFPQPSPIHTTPPAQFGQEPNYQPPQQYSQPQTPYQQVPVSYDNNLDTKPAVSQSMPHQSIYQQQPTSRVEEQSSYSSHSNISPRSDHYPTYSDSRPVMHSYNSNTQIPVHQIQASSAEMSQAGSYNFVTTVSHTDFSHAGYASTQIPFNDYAPDVKYMPQPVLEQPVAVSRAQNSQPQLLLSGFGGEDHFSPTQLLDEAAVEHEDDDYWDVQSDEEMGDAEDGADENSMLASKDFSMIRRIHFENSNELGIRRYDAFLYDGLLTKYRPEYAASPLRNSKTARVFAHFIHVTGPTLTIYERNPRNPNSLFEGPTPAVQQSLWTYILPLKALGHQALLHAMLALSSLHIARLQGASITPSYKHYAYSLKRLGRCLGDPKKRLSIPTLATSLLLAYYEVWTAEHVKWSTHLVGAAQLVTEFDFRSLTREARRLKAAEIAQERQFPHQNPEMLIDQRSFNKRLDESMLMPDEDLISTIIGKKVSYDDFGLVFEENGEIHDKETRIPTPLDLKSYETLQDLYWWNARHDVLQSIVSGNPLIMPYRKWSDCPPRAPLGRSDALFGTIDHVMLLLGRIADFSVNDRDRKIRQVEADGGWRPKPGMPGFGSMGPPGGINPNSGTQPPTPTTPMGPPSHMQGPPQGWKGPPPPGFGPPQNGPPNPNDNSGQNAPGASPTSMPSFFGMAPSAPLASLPASYANPSYERTPPTPNTPHPKYADLPAAYEAAIAEWDAISAAHAKVAHILSNTSAFATLPLDMAPPVPGGNSNMTPFGPALVHRSYDISVIWTFVHLAKIILLRSHPAMPPAAHMAAGVCAQATGPYATLIGRITAGMQLPMGENLSPFLGAVMCEVSMSLFFAGIQYQDPKQREWVITRLLETDRRTGWASAGIIARGIETSWEKAAQLGRGPPYKRRTRRIGEQGPLVLDTEELDSSEEQKTWRSREKDDYGKGGRFGTREVWEEKEGGSRERGYVMKTVILPYAMNLLGTEEDLRESMERVGL